MPRHLVATLFIGLAISAILIGLYYTEIFLWVGWWVYALYQGTFLEVEPGLLYPLQYGVIIALAYGSAWVAIDSPSVAGLGVIAFLAALAVVILSPTLALYGQLFEPASGILSITLGISAGSIFARSEPGKRRHLLRTLLGERVAPSHIHELTEAKTPPQLDSVTRPVAALTCRIINKDELASSLDPDTLANISTRFHTLVCSHLLSRRGFLESETPDCTLTYFGLIPALNQSSTSREKLPPAQNHSENGSKNTDPKRDQAKEMAQPSGTEDQPPSKSDRQKTVTASETDSDTDSKSGLQQADESPQTSLSSEANFSAAAVDACHAALELFPHLHNLSSECEKETGHRLIAGIGIECGIVTTCLVGEGSRQRLGAVGNVADFTHRLSAANGTYGSDILIGSSAFHAARDAIEVRPVEMLYNPADNHLSEIYQLIDEKGLLSEGDMTRRHAYWEGVVLLRQNLPDEALEKFSRAKDGRRHDPPLAYFIKKAKALRADRESGDPNASPEPQHARNTATF